MQVKSFTELHQLKKMTNGEASHPCYVVTNFTRKKLQLTHEYNLEIGEAA